jgi:hypothetical protein
MEFQFMAKEYRFCHIALLGFPFPLRLEKRKIPFGIDIHWCSDLNGRQYNPASFAERSTERRSRSLAT